MQTFIYIATTQGPVRVQAITEEDPDIKSVVCLDGMAEPLAISDRYHDFVKKGTGLIHREFGYGSYRVDVDKPIDQGSSWQLGVYCAHVLHQRKELFNDLPKNGDRVLLVTGAVKSNGDVSAVERVAEKFRAAAIQLEEWNKQGCHLLCLVAEAQGGVPYTNEWNLIVQRVDSIRDISSILGSEQNSLEEVSDVEAGNIESAGRQAWLLALVVVIAVVVSFVSWQQYNSRIPSVNLPKSTALMSKENEIGMTSELNLIAGIFGETGECDHSTSQVIPLGKNNQFQPSSFQHLCSITFYPGERNIQALLAFSLDRLGVIQLAKDLSGWKVPIPLAQDNDRSYVVIAIYEGDITRISNRLNKQLLRWNLTGADVTFVEVSNWLKQLSVKAEAYQHTLKN